MAVILTDTNSIFVHIPKTGGMSMQKWLLENTQSHVTKGAKHYSLKSLEEKYGAFNFSFAVVRNPWDWCASWYRGKFSLEYNQQVLKEFEKGFEYFIQTTNLQQQYTRIVGITKILKLESIDNDILPIAKMFNIECPFPVVNTSNRNKNYRDYYNSVTKDIVSKKFAEDIEMFKYSF
jgi:hypothetical protein